MSHLPDRTAQGGRLILGRRGGYLYADDDRSQVDTEAFEREAERGRLALASGNAAAALQEYLAALELWTGDPFMENMYAEWAQDFRRRFALLHEEALAGLAWASLELGQVTAAVHAARQLTQGAPLREEGHVLLMKALAAVGDLAAAIGVFHGWRLRLGRLPRGGENPIGAQRQPHLRLWRGAAGPLTWRGR